MLRVAVVGAGPAGLCAAKHCKDAGFQCTVYEQAGEIGGTWRYTDCVGTDDYGAPVHTSMYRNLMVNNIPFIATIEGEECFRGHSMHSHDFRDSEPFRDRRVLVVGGGPSAMDLTEHISHSADKVFMSHHSAISNLGYGNNVEIKHDVRRLLEHSVEFVDGSVENIDTLVYCTGYSKNYKFLDESCGITEDEGLVYPLFKHCINANQPSMCVLGNLVYTMQFYTFDLQVRFFLKSLAGNILPGCAEMLEDIRKNMERKLVDGAPKKALFSTKADEDRIYFEQLVELAGLDPVPNVLVDIKGHAAVQLLQNFGHFRQNKYVIVDKDNFQFYPAPRDDTEEGVAL